MKRHLIIIVALFLVFVVSAVVHAPAQVIYYFKDSFPRALNISQVSGTVWHGKAMSVKWQDRSQTVDLGSIVWNVNWMGFLSGNLSVDTRFGQNSSMQISGKGQIKLSASEVRIPSMMIRFPVANLTPFIPSPIPFDISGQGTVNLKNMVVNGTRCVEGNGVVQWDQGRVNVFSQDIDLDLVKSTLTCRDGNISLQTNQSSKMFRSQIQGTLSTGHRTDFSGSVIPLENVPPMLLKQLESLPEAENGQGYLVKYQGRW